MSAPDTPKPIVATRFGYPFKDRQGQEITDPQAFHDGIANVHGGHYLLSPHGFFHGGVHVAWASNKAFQLEEGIRCLADGEVVAYRINRRYEDATPGTAGDGPALRPYSTGFVLVRHRLQAPSPPQPPKPAPTTNPGADINNWGTWLCEDSHGRKHLAWLRHGTSLTVEIGTPAPGQGNYVRVKGTSGFGVPNEGWIKRSALALDPLAGTSLRNQMGFKDLVATQVYRGDIIDTDAVAAHARNKAEQERPPIPPAPTLTLYSLYMHVAHLESYGTHERWKLPPWWPVSEYRVGAKAKDRVKSRVPAAIGLNIRQAPGKSPVLGLLLRGSLIELGETSADRKWARIARVIEGGIESVHTDGSIPPDARLGWVFIAELDATGTPETLDGVVTLKAGHPVKQGDVMGYLGEDVPRVHTRSRDNPYRASGSIWRSSAVTTYPRISLQAAAGPRSI